MKDDRGRSVSVVSCVSHGPCQTLHSTRDLGARSSAAPQHSPRPPEKYHAHSLVTHVLTGRLGSDPSAGGSACSSACTSKACCSGSGAARPSATAPLDWLPSEVDASSGSPPILSESSGRGMRGRTCAVHGHASGSAASAGLKSLCRRGGPREPAACPASAS